MFGQIWKFIEWLLGLWRDIPQPTKDKIIDLLIECFDATFRAYYRWYRKWTNA